MTTFALDDDWVEISADDYSEEEDEYGAPIIGRAQVIFPGGETRYYGLFAPEYADDDLEEDEDD